MVKRDNLGAVVTAGLIFSLPPALHVSLRSSPTSATHPSPKRPVTNDPASHWTRHSHHFEGILTNRHRYAASVSTSSPAELVTSNEVIDTVLARYREQLGSEARAYRHHVYRGLNFQLRLLDAAPSNLLALAWVCHDLGLWTAHTLDYIPSSVQIAEELAPEFGVNDLGRLRIMIELHHRVRRIADPVAEAFRHADRTDAWKGGWRGPLLQSDIDQATLHFPYCGFHRFLRRTVMAYAIRHPLHPLPMFRW